MRTFFLASFASRDILFPLLALSGMPFFFFACFFASQSILLPLHALSGMPFFLFCMSFSLLGAYFFSCFYSLVCLFFLFACLFRFPGHTFSLTSTLWYAFLSFSHVFGASRGILFPLHSLLGMSFQNSAWLIDLFTPTKGILLSSILHGRFQFQSNV